MDRADCDRLLNQSRLSYRRTGPSTADRVDGRVVGDAEQPCGRILRQALIRPALEGPQHGLLYAFFRKVQVRRT